ncbi:type II toxin-antitoxin system antitoxin HipB [Pseudidiomarina aestuarii]|uniref:type II toxin-antitoxin system antitoxin HipB n=1 Tax=Pseudidiomarina aestuarii TaxID=624146 RepID=UPI003A982B88
MINITRPEQLSTFIKEYRKQQQLTQSDVAKLIGIRVATISDFENNPKSSKLETFFKILAALHLQMELTSRAQAVNEQQSRWNEEW